MKRSFFVFLLGIFWAGCSTPPLEWEVVGESEFTVLSVTTHVRGDSDPQDRGRKVTSIRVVFDGVAAGDVRPVMIADGRELFVGGHGHSYTANGPQSSVEAELLENEIPEQLIIRWFHGVDETEVHLKLEQ